VSVRAFAFSGPCFQLAIRTRITPAPYAWQQRCCAVDDVTPAQLMEAPRRQGAARSAGPGRGGGDAAPDRARDLRRHARDSRPQARSSCEILIETPAMKRGSRRSFTLVACFIRFSRVKSSPHLRRTSTIIFPVT
jgi:hypothetical protein